MKEARLSGCLSRRSRRRLTSRCSGPSALRAAGSPARLTAGLRGVKIASMKLELAFLAAPIAAVVVLTPAAASADVPKATIVPQAEAHAEPPRTRETELQRYKRAHRLRVAGGVLMAAGSIPLIAGSIALPSLWRRNAEGSVGNGAFDMLVVGVFVSGLVCELIGVPLSVTGLSGPMVPPEQPAWTPRASRRTGGVGLGWSF